MEYREALMEQADCKALIGVLTYEDARMMPAVLIRIEDGKGEENLRGLYRDRRIRFLTLHVEGNTVTVESAQDLLDGNRLENLHVKFTPEHPEDIDAFMATMSVTRAWLLIVQLPKEELHFAVQPDTDEVVKSYWSRHRSELRSCNKQ